MFKPIIRAYIHHTGQIYDWCVKNSKYYYSHFVKDIVMPPTSVRYWNSVTEMRLTDQL